MRGTDPDASLYWFVRMLDGGVDPRYAARRLVRMASEDIGLADPRALRLALDAAETYERLGSPEGELALAQAVVYLAMAPKSNAVYTAFNAARAFVKHDGTRPVPLRLRNAPTAADEEPRLRQGLSLRARRGRRLRRRRALLARRHASRRASTSRSPRGLEIRIGERLAELRAPERRRPREAASERRAAPRSGGLAPLGRANPSLG